MKSNFIIIILISAFFSSCRDDIKQRTFVTSEISVIFPDSVVKPYMVTENIEIFAIINDSSEYIVTVADNKKIINSDSINKIENIDANLYKFTETQFGSDLKTSQRTIDGHLAIEFTFNSNHSELNKTSIYNGALIYHKNYMIIASFNHDNTFIENSNFKKEKFLNSINIK